jgi:hypothetical protein
MFRHLFYAAACLSAFLLLATLILWPLSYRQTMMVSYFSASETTATLSASAGRVAFCYQEDHSIISPGWGLRVWDVSQERERYWSYWTWSSSQDDGDRWDALGMLANHFTGNLAYDEWAVPCSYLAVLWAVLPVMAWRHRRPRRVGGAFEVEPAKSRQPDLREE